jgi:hypothetical protein
VISFELPDDESMAEIGASGYSVRQVSAVSADAYEGQKSLALAFNVLAKKPEYKGLFQRRLFGLLLWTAENEVSSEHFCELPQTLCEFEAWAENHGLPLGRALAARGDHGRDGRRDDTAKRAARRSCRSPQAGSSRPPPLAGDSRTIELVWRRSDPRADDFANLAVHLQNFRHPGIEHCDSASLTGSDRSKKRA